MISWKAPNLRRIVLQILQIVACCAGQAAALADCVGLVVDLAPVFLILCLFVVPSCRHMIQCACLLDLPKTTKPAPPTVLLHSQASQQPRLWDAINKATLLEDMIRSGQGQDQKTKGGQCHFADTILGARKHAHVGYREISPKAPRTVQRDAGAHILPGSAAPKQ